MPSAATRARPAMLELVRRQVLRQTTQVFHVDDKYVYFAAGPTAGDSTVVRVAK
jgi:hypothetical protein